MKTRTLFVLLAAIFCSLTAAQAQNLEAVLNAMDKAAANFHTAQCDFVWDQYQKVVDDHDFQKGTMYFRREGNEVEVATDITSPTRKYVLAANGKVSLYQPPPLDQVTEYSTGKNKADIESFMVLGFGGRGHDLANSFVVKYVGTEQAQGVSSAKLELTPKSARVAGMFKTITLWIDPVRGVSVQQEFLEPSGDYRLAKYSNIQVNGKIPGDVFKLKTTSRTKIVRPSS
jgi:outer membrane lipoprotein-sorting protein